MTDGGAPPPAWAVSRRGVVRALVLACTAVAVVGVVLLGDPDLLESDPVLWVVAVGCAAAGLASAVRSAAVPIVPSGDRLAAMSGAVDPGEARVSGAVSRATLADAGWSGLLVVAAFLVRTLGRMLAVGADPIELLYPVLFAFVWFTAFTLGAVLGFLVAAGAGSAVRLVAARRRGEKVAPEWWAVPVALVALAVLAVAGLVSVTLFGAPSARGLGGVLALLAWDFGGQGVAGVVVGVAVRVSAYAVAASIVVLAIGRLRGRRSPRPPGR